MSEEKENSHTPEQPPQKTTVSFAPADPTDGRPAGSWRTRYDDGALPFIIKRRCMLAFYSSLSLL
jgi:hypothetical protein